MSSISAVSSAPSYIPSVSNAYADRYRDLAIFSGGGSAEPKPIRSPGYVPLGGFGGASVFVAQMLGGGPVLPGYGGWNNGNPFDAGVGTQPGGGGGTGGGTAPGGVGPGDGSGGGPGPVVLGAVSMQSGDGYDLFTGNVLQGASSFPADSGLSTGDFQLSADASGTVSLTLGSGGGVPLQVSIQRGTAFDAVTSGDGAAYAAGGGPIQLGTGDTAIIDYGGFMTYAVGNVARQGDGSISFDVKEIPGTSAAGAPDGDTDGVAGSDGDDAPDAATTGPAPDGGAPASMSGLLDQAIQQMQAMMAASLYAATQARSDGAAAPGPPQAPGAAGTAPVGAVSAIATAGAGISGGAATASGISASGGAVGAAGGNAGVSTGGGTSGGGASGGAAAGGGASASVSISV